MTCIIDTKSKRHLSANLAAGLAISAFLVLGTFVAAASAAQHGGGGGGFYYRAPPVVYGSPYYYPPPVIYPGIGITLPGVSIGVW